MDRLVALGEAVQEGAVLERRRAVRADDLATLIYTSGTTGRPKGCELTHRNMQTEVRSVAEMFPQLLTAGGSVLLFLPLAHVFGKAIQCGATYTGTVIGHTAHVPDLVGDLRAFRPTFLLAVPRVFEKVYNSACQRAHDDGKGKFFDVATDTAIAWSRARDTGGPGLGLRLRHAVFDRLVYAKLRAAVGGRVLAAVSGSAPLGERLGHFFRGVGLPVLEGYGLTETSAGVTVNTLDAQRIGTVGRPVPGHAVRIADDGEILVKGPIVFRGYWKNDTATGEALTDGWFHTGDIGELDDAGYLTITGRKKELIVTAGGKNVAPAVLEDRLRAHPLVSQCMVVGDGKPFIAALVTIDAEALPGWLERSGKPAGTPLARPRGRPRPARRDRRGGGGREPRGVAGRADPRIPHPPGGLHRGGRRDDADDEGQAIGRRGEVRCGHRGHLRRPQAARLTPRSRLPSPMRAPLARTPRRTRLPRRAASPAGRPGRPSPSPAPSRRGPRRPSPLRGPGRRAGRRAR